MSSKTFFLTTIAILTLFACSQEGKRLKTESGYEYEVIRKGSNEAIPADHYIFFHMERFIDDSLLQSTVTTGKPGVLKIIEGQNYGPLKPLVDLMATMHKGDSVHFFMPIDSFERKPAGFDHTSGIFVYRVGIFDVMDEARFTAYSDSLQNISNAERQLVIDRLPAIVSSVKTTYESYKKGELASQMQTMPSGLKYIIHEEGSGAVPARGETVSVQYYGILDTEATTFDPSLMFDNSFANGQPFQFPIGVGKVIQGWDQGLMLLKRGTKATFFIPSALAYGASGFPPKIPENADLIFYVELE